MAFVHYTVKKIVHGLGAIKEAANEVKNLKGSKAFIVTDPGLAKIGVQKPLEEALTAGGIEWKLYAEAQLEPSMDSIQHCTDEAKAFGADVIIGFGGGSALDTTKAASVLLSNEGPIDKYFGINLVPNPSLPCILIPTTSGTGSEVTFTAVMHDVENQRKISTRDREKLVPDYALLDPEMTVTLPKDMTGATGLDAMAHAVEGYLKPEAHVYSDPLCLQSMKMVYENLYNAWLHPDDLEARDNMLLASNIAMGVQIGHGIGQALGAYTHAAHGVTCAWALPYVVEHLCDTEAPKIREIAKAFGLQLPEGASNVEVKDAVVGAIKDLSAAVELPMPRDLGFTMEKDYENFVKFVMREQRLLQMSARPVTEENVRAYMTDLLHR